MAHQEYVVRIYDSGDKEWRQNDKLHRLDGPAIEYANGIKYWYQNDKLHRLDGPAVEWSKGDKQWYIDDVKLTEQEHAARTAKPAVCGKTITIDGVEYVIVLKK